MNNGDAQERTKRMIKIAIGTAALTCLAAGFILYLFGERLGVDPDMAEFISVAFMVVGITDFILLHFWDRLANRRQ